MAIDPARALEYFTAKMSFTTGPVELSKKMKGGDVRVVDVRTSDDFAREHIPGSINLPESEWANAEAHGLSREQTNVLLCYSQVCHLAARAAVELAKQGFPVMELEGGFDSWKKHGLATEHGQPQHADSPVARARELLAETREAQKSTQTETQPTEPKPAEEKKPAEETKPAEEKKPQAADAKPAEVQKPDATPEGQVKTESPKGDGVDKADEEKAGDAKTDADADDDKPPVKSGRRRPRPSM